jgi:hypothetical protein
VTRREHSRERMKARLLFSSVVIACDCVMATAAWHIPPLPSHAIFRCHHATTCNLPSRRVFVGPFLLCMLSPVSECKGTVELHILIDCPLPWTPERSMPRSTCAPMTRRRSNNRSSPTALHTLCHARFPYADAMHGQRRAFVRVSTGLLHRGSPDHAQAILRQQGVQGDRQVYRRRKGGKGQLFGSRQAQQCSCLLLDVERT